MRFLKYIKRLLGIKPCSPVRKASGAKEPVRHSYQSYTVDDYLEKLGVDVKGEMDGEQAETKKA